MSLATGTIYRITFKSKRHNFQRQRRPIYIVIHRQIFFIISELFSVARWVGFPKLGSKKPIQDSTNQPRGNWIQPISHEETGFNQSATRKLAQAKEI